MKNLFSCLLVSLFASYSLADRFDVTQIYDRGNGVTPYLKWGSEILLPGGRWTDGYQTQENIGWDLGPIESGTLSKFIEYKGEAYFNIHANLPKGHFSEWYVWEQDVGPVYMPQMKTSQTKTTSPIDPFVFEDRLYFSANGDNGRQLYAYDGEQTHQVSALDRPQLGTYMARQFGDSMLLASRNYLLKLENQTLTEIPRDDFNDQQDLMYARGAHELFQDGFLYGPFGREINPLFRTDGETLEPYDVNWPDGVTQVRVAELENQVYAYGVEDDASLIYRFDGDEFTQLSYEGESEIQKILCVCDGIDRTTLVVATERGRESAIIVDSEIQLVRPLGDELTHNRQFLPLSDGSWMIREVGEESGLTVFQTNDFESFERLPEDAVENMEWLDYQIGGYVRTPDGTYFTSRLDSASRLLWTDGYGVREFDEFSIHGTLVSSEDLFWFDDAFYAVAKEGFFKIVPDDSVARVDYDHSDNVDAGDLDVQAMVMSGDNHYPAFDLNNDGNVDLADRSILVRDFLQTDFGDANLDGTFNSNDLVAVFQAAEYEDGIANNSTWSEGDWDGDGDFTTRDLVLSFSTSTYEVGAAAVPEPTGIASLFLVACIALFGRCRRDRRSWQR